MDFSIFTKLHSHYHNQLEHFNHPEKETLYLLAIISHLPTHPLALGNH